MRLDRLSLKEGAARGMNFGEDWYKAKVGAGRIEAI
jgi:hypothetical protein